ncbi:MAG TPA: dephospho-CoA kinase [Pyrinomonadaceae bacterium]|nr:dephospho-CoA kinase [Pyrinomonadaceae bacterium]
MKLTNSMLRVGLTGSIAVGKSFVTSIFSELGCHTLDADETAREVVLPGSPGLDSVAATFGIEILNADGTLNRQRLGEMIFADEAKRQKLNQLLHPFIIARQDEIMRAWEQEDPNGIGIIDAALMIESGGYRRFDKLIVVHCRPEVQLERLMLRSNLGRDEAQARIDAQMPQAEKQRFADYLIDTSDGFEVTRTRTLEVYEALRRLANKQK